MDLGPEIGRVVVARLGLPEARVGVGVPGPVETPEVRVPGVGLAVVDVREPYETNSGVIEGAYLYPWSSGVLRERHDELPSDRPLYVICRSGSRSAVASDFLFEQGHSCVHNVLGGMSTWTNAGYPTVTP